MFKNISELRQDLVSGEWVAIATGRAQKPNFYTKHKKLISQSKKNCPFEDVKKNGNEILFSSPFVSVIKNKYPAFSYGQCNVEHREGPYSWLEGYGFHEVFVYKDHKKDLDKFNSKETAAMFLTFLQRYLSLKNDACVEYISIFHNHGQEAGASISHPHSQLIAVPVIPPDINRSLIGSKNFYHKNKKCVHCLMIEWEKKSKKRVIFENKNFISFCPYVSRLAFEMRIFPKIHQSNFENNSESLIYDLAEVFNSSINKLSLALKNPSYNFFIHTAPPKMKDEHNHYHWHIEIVPKTSIWAGFEIGTGIEISTITPESAAKFLRKF